MKNFSANSPIKCLEKADENLVSGRVAEVMSDENLLKIHKETFFTAMEQPIHDGLTAYAKSKDKKVDYLTEDEIMFVIDKVADYIRKSGF